MGVGRYRAFLSYSRKDERAANRLFRSLERYRLPRKFRGKAANISKDGRLGTFYRDREYMAATPSLSGDIIAALARSDFLIVLCSPAAAASDWVNREIIEFKRLHGEARVLAVILSGEPNAAPGSGLSECLPPALRQKVAADGSLTGEAAEPGGVDLRPGGDGETLGRLRLVAAMTGIDLATLQERDRRRRQHRLQLRGAVFFTLALAFGSAWIMTSIARNEAQTQRDRAEALIGYMLGELNDNIRELGRLDFLEGLSGRVLGHYSGENEAAMTCQSLIYKAEALMLESRVRRSQFRPAAAEIPSRTALQLFHENIDRCTGLPAFHKSHAYAEGWAVTPLLTRATKSAASAGLERAEQLRLLRRVVNGGERMEKALAPLKQFAGCQAEYAYEISEAKLLKISALLHMEEIDEGLLETEEALSILETLPLAEVFPLAGCTGQTITLKSVLHRKADLKSWQAGIAFYRKDYDLATLLYEETLALYEKVAGTEETRDWPAFRQATGMRYSLARIAKASGKPVEAARWLAAARADCRQLLNRDRDNLEWVDICRKINSTE